eukprot:jgi/Hompol1/5413/HPOL_004392-RA
MKMKAKAKVMATATATVKLRASVRMRRIRKTTGLGYHPVNIGDLFANGRYRVIRKLGWGHFSTVWLAVDSLRHRPVALKIVKSAANYTEAARDEIDLLETVVTKQPDHPHRKSVVELFDHFEVTGPNGTHVAMVFEVLGPNLWNMIRRYRRRGIPVAIVKRIAKQVLMGLNYLHFQCGIIHTDLKPEDTGSIMNFDNGSSLTLNAYAMQSSDSLAVVAASSTSTVPQTNVHLPESTVHRPTDHLEKTLSDISLVDADLANEIRGSVTAPTAAQQNEKQTAVPSGIQSMDISPTPSPDRKRRRNAAQASDKKRRDLQITVKIADLGNACWVNRHFTSDIQTRQYRSPEVIIGSTYDVSADMWSLACILFELLTGDYLFDPQSGSRYTKDDDHIAQIIELLGTFPRHLALSGKFSANIFNRRGELRHIHKLRYWKLQDVLHEKYRFSRTDAEGIAGFLLPMLDINPARRATASEQLLHSWLADVDG